MLKPSCLLPRHRRRPCSFSILTVTLTLILLVHTRGQESFTGMESYARYPGWNGLSVSDSLLQITFRTSHSDGLILYGEGRFEDDVQSEFEALEIKLDGGQISFNVKRRQMMSSQSLRESKSEQFYLSENLNDNRPHTLSLRRTAGTLSVSIVDDAGSAVSSNLLGTSSPIGSMEIYVGGLPVDVTSQLSTSISPFVGCFDSIQFSNTSSTPESLVYVTPLEQVGVEEGCTNPCANVSCGNGNCVAILPSRFYCDCSSTMMGGANCNEDLSAHRLNLTLDSYLCYSLNMFPFIDRFASVRLIPPLPVSGTIMTGFSPRGDYFSAYLENSILKIDFVLSNDSRLQLNTSQPLSSSTTYQIDLQLRSDQVQLVVATVSGSSLTEVERLSESTVAPAASGFTTVCAGGTLLEVPYYEGCMERVIFNHVTLSDQTFVGDVLVESRTNVISFKRNILDPPLTFERVINFSNSLSIMFEMRMEQDKLLAGTPLEIKNEGTTLSLIVLQSKFTLFGISADFSFITVPCPEEQPAIDDNRWHHIDLTLIRNADGTADFRLIVDYKLSGLCQQTMQSDRQTLGTILTELVDSGATIDFGVPKGDLNSDTVVNFVGCFKNFEFSVTNDSSPLRPDLSLMIRTEERFGSGDACYGCISPDICNNGNVCFDCGFNVSAQCAAPGSPCPTAETVIPTNTTTTTTTTTLGQTPPTTSLPTTFETSDEETITTTTTSPSLLTSAQIGTYIGVAVAAAIAVFVAVIVTIILLCVFVRVRAGKQGFYKTEESNGKVVTMLHYSASLRQIASEQVTMAETNGVSPMHSDGLRPKEFYM